MTAVSERPDHWGEPVSGASSSVDAWNRAWVEATHFVGDPFLTLAAANRDDEAFMFGSVFCGTYRILGGARPDSDEVNLDAQRVAKRSRPRREAGHAEAFQLLRCGDFTKAALQWDIVASDNNDFAAVRFAHDVYLHVGNATRRLRSSEQAFAQWEPDQPGWGFIASMLSFALEEVGRYGEAEDLAWQALAADPMDLWALHSLAHLYESLDDSDSALDLLRDRQDVWSAQDGLAVHIWWHLALRLIATGAFDEALAIHDDQLDVASTPFRMCDLISLLWRLELAGVDVGDRWDGLADRFAERPEWHTSGFLDLHGAFLYSRRPQHDAATRFFRGVETSHGQPCDEVSENEAIFADVVKPLVGAIRRGANDPSSSVEILDSLATDLHRIGGSNAQRDIVALTRNHFASASEAT